MSTHRASPHHTHPSTRRVFDTTRPSIHSSGSKTIHPSTRSSNPSPSQHDHPSVDVSGGLH
ncbi:hypothetical protein H4R33_003436 [Dimargaris cristalligena]|nr:hypothetical protein H4R33_003436 [Dimargaris cristalligena]